MITGYLLDIEAARQQREILQRATRQQTIDAGGPLSAPQPARGRLLLRAVAIASVMALVLLNGMRSAHAEDGAWLKVDNRGTFAISFGATTSRVDFGGAGVSRLLGRADVAGHSVLVPSGIPGCSQIIEDRVTETTSSGDSLILQASGLDCFDASTGQIHGAGTFKVLGGTGRFKGASGGGVFAVRAQIEHQAATSATGTFDPLSFRGVVSMPDGDS